MNVTVENLAACKRLIRVEIDSNEVDTAFETMTKDFQRQVSIPGFRQGKAPKDMVVKRYEKDIQEEVRKKVIPDAYRKAISEQKLDVVGYPDIEEIQFAKGQALQFAATIEIAPEFELPEYKGLTIKREVKDVTDADIERAITMLRQQRTEYKTVDREAKEGDVAVVNYTGTVDGKPITDIAPTARGLTEQKNFWINIDKTTFIPGFADQLIGAKGGEKRTVNVDFPADFVTPQLVNLKGVYEVEVVEVKERLLPELNDEFAKSFGAEDLQKLREGIRTDLHNELTIQKQQKTRDQAVELLLNLVQFELPESLVSEQTRNVVYDIVQQNQKRGVPTELIEKEKDQIYATATEAAKKRVKANFILRKISTKENVNVTQQEVSQRIVQLAGMYQITPAQFVKDLEKNNGIYRIYDDIATEKTLALVIQYAVIEDVAPEAPAAESTSPAPAA